jgi:acid phosphatase
MDVRFHHMMGYGNSLSPYLGMPWVKTAKHLLAGKDGKGKLPHQGEDPVESEEVEVWNGKEFAKLPKPELPPNATHTQL